MSSAWTASRPRLVVGVGLLVAVGGNAASLAYALVTQTLAVGLELLPPLLALGSALAALAYVMTRSALAGRGFLGVALVSTLIVLLSFPGLPGGAIALAGALWGLLAMHEMSDARPG